MRDQSEQQATLEEKKAARRFVWLLIANMLSIGHLLLLIVKDTEVVGYGVIAFVVAITLGLRFWGKRLPLIEDPNLRRERGLKNMHKLLLAGLVMLGLIWTARFLLF